MSSELFLSIASVKPPLKSILSNTHSEAAQLNCRLARKRVFPLVDEGIDSDHKSHVRAEIYLVRMKRSEDCKT